MTYIPGDYWAICQRTGIKFRISELREEPSKDEPNTGLWVHKSVVDPVQPQEYVRGVEDDPSVPLSFPDNLQVVGETTLAFTTTQNSHIVVIPTGISSQYDPIGVVMDDSITFWDYALIHYPLAEPLWDSNGSMIFQSDGTAGVLLARSALYDTIFINQQIWTAAAAGNAVYLPAQNNEESQ